MLHKKCLDFRGRLLLVAICLLVLVTLSNERAVIGAKKMDQLNVKGTRLVNGKGKTVRLKGVSTHGIAWFPQYVNKKAFQSFKKWGANVIRLALYSDKGAGYDDAWYKKLDEGVKYATELNMYVILDWHILSDGNPKMNQKDAERFFSRMSKRYKNHTNVIYEICNEPNGDVTWERDVRPYALEMIKIIRKHTKDAIIIVGTPTWSQDVDLVSENPIKGYQNIMYAFHFYAATHKEDLRNRMQKAVDNGLPIFVSEFGICDSSGNGAIDYAEAKRWMNLLSRNKISYVAWNLSNKGETSALIRSSCKKTGDWKKRDLSPSGKWLLKQLKKR